MLSFLFVSFVSVFIHAQSTPTDTNACQTRCAGNAPVKIDVAGQCMCVGDKCFKVGIGHDGSMMTASGNGKLTKTPPGEKYKTYENNDSPADDAIAMGIPSNDAVGKWIHKPANCANAETYRTKGCIAVPCDVWTLVKDAYREGSDLTVCNGRSSGPSRPPSYNREWNEDTQQYIEK